MSTGLNLATGLATPASEHVSIAGPISLYKVKIVYNFCLIFLFQVFIYHKYVK